MSDPIDRLRTADPARRLHLDDLGPAAWQGLHEAILRTEREPAASPARPARRRWRLGRSTTLVLGVAVALTAGGLATIPGFLGGAVDGPNCLRAWGEAAEVAGPWVTGDPVADCETYWEQAGIEPPDDLVGFTVSGLTYVAPEDEVPQGAVALDGGPVYSAAELELRASAADLVDGGMVCRSVDDAALWARGELDRLGLSGSWTVSVPEQTDAGDGVDRPCSSVDAADGTVSVVPAEDPAVTMFPNGNWRADLLREQIADACVTVEEARAIVDAMLADEDHWPTSSVVDETVDCARVDLEIGGSVQVTVYGPTGTATAAAAPATPSPAR
ncbi:MAG TPA: hypothetical protein VGC67_16825 [Cellulomonas sp.]